MSQARMDEGDVDVGDVVQVRPSSNPPFAACFVLVTEVRPWGIIGNVLVPAAGGPNIAPLRVKHEDYAWIGPAEWSLDFRP